MAKEKHDVSSNDPAINDRDWDSFNIPGMGGPSAAKNTREAVGSAIKDGMSGFKNELFDTSADKILEFSKKAMPNSISSDVEKIENAKNGVMQAFNENIGGLKKEIGGLAGTLAKFMPQNSKLEKLLTGIDKKMAGEQSRQQEQDKQAAQDREIQEGILSALGQMTEKSHVDAMAAQAIQAKQSATTSILLQNIYAETHLLRNFTYDIANKYYRKSLELQYRSLFVQKELLEFTKFSMDTISKQLEVVVHNTALPDILKTKSKEFYEAELKGRIRGTMIDTFYKHFNPMDSFAKKAADKMASTLRDFATGVGSYRNMLDMIASQKEMGMSPAMMAGGMLAGGVKDFLAKRMQPFIEKMPGFARLRYKVKNFTQDPGLLFKAINKKFTKDTKLHALMRKFGSLGMSLAAGPGMELGTYGRRNLDEVAPFDGRAHAALTKVIPGYLAKILAEVTGIRTKINKDWKSKDHELVFDNHDDMFRTAKQQRGMIKDRVKQTFDDSVMSYMGSLRQSLQDIGLKLSGAEMNVLSRSLVKYFMQGGSSTAAVALWDANFLNNIENKSLRKKFAGFKSKAQKAMMQDPYIQEGISNALGSIRAGLPSAAREFETAYKSGGTEMLLRTGVSDGKGGKMRLFTKDAHGNIQTTQEGQMRFLLDLMEKSNLVDHSDDFDYTRDVKASSQFAVTKDNKKDVAWATKASDMLDRGIASVGKFIGVDLSPDKFADIVMSSPDKLKSMVNKYYKGNSKELKKNFGDIVDFSKSYLNGLKTMVKPGASEEEREAAEQLREEASKKLKKALKETIDGTYGKVDFNALKKDLNEQKNKALKTAKTKADDLRKQTAKLMDDAYKALPKGIQKTGSDLKAAVQNNGWYKAARDSWASLRNLSKDQLVDYLHAKGLALEGFIVNAMPEGPVKDRMKKAMETMRNKSAEAVAWVEKKIETVKDPAEREKWRQRLKDYKDKTGDILKDILEEGVKDGLLIKHQQEIDNLKKAIGSKVDSIKDTIKDTAEAGISKLPEGAQGAVRSGIDKAEGLIGKAGAEMKELREASKDPFSLANYMSKKIKKGWSLWKARPREFQDVEREYVEVVGKEAIENGTAPQFDTWVASMGYNIKDPKKKDQSMLKRLFSAANRLDRAIATGLFKRITGIGLGKGKKGLIRRVLGAPFSIGKVVNKSAATGVIGDVLDLIPFGMGKVLKAPFQVMHTMTEMTARMVAKKEEEEDKSSDDKRKGSWKNRFLNAKKMLLGSKEDGKKGIVGKLKDFVKEHPFKTMGIIGIAAAIFGILKSTGISIEGIVNGVKNIINGVIRGFNAVNSVMTSIAGLFFGDDVAKLLGTLATGLLGYGMLRHPLKTAGLAFSAISGLVRGGVGVGRWGWEKFRQAREKGRQKELKRQEKEARQQQARQQSSGGGGRPGSRLYNRSYTPLMGGGGPGYGSGHSPGYGPGYNRGGPGYNPNYSHLGYGGGGGPGYGPNTGPNNNNNTKDDHNNKNTKQPTSKVPDVNTKNTSYETQLKNYPKRKGGWLWRLGGKALGGIATSLGMLMDGWMLFMGLSSIWDNDGPDKKPKADADDDKNKKKQTEQEKADKEKQKKMEEAKNADKKKPQPDAPNKKSTGTELVEKTIDEMKKAPGSVDPTPPQSQGWFSRTWNAIKESVTNGLTQTLEYFKNGIANFIDKIVSTWDKIKNGWKRLYNVIMAACGRSGGLMKLTAGAAKLVVKIAVKSAVFLGKVAMALLGFATGGLSTVISLVWMAWDLGWVLWYWYKGRSFWGAMSEQLLGINLFDNIEDLDQDAKDLIMAADTVNPEEIKKVDEGKIKAQIEKIKTEDEEKWKKAVLEQDAGYLAARKKQSDLNAAHNKYSKSQEWKNATAQEKHDYSLKQAEKQKAMMKELKAAEAKALEGKQYTESEKARSDIEKLQSQLDTKDQKATDQNPQANNVTPENMNIDANKAKAALNKTTLDKRYWTINKKTSGDLQPEMIRRLNLFGELSNQYLKQRDGKNYKPVQWFINSGRRTLAQEEENWRFNKYLARLGARGWGKILANGTRAFYWQDPSGKVTQVGRKADIASRSIALLKDNKNRFTAKEWQSISYRMGNWQQYAAPGTSPHGPGHAADIPALPFANILDRDSTVELFQGTGVPKWYKKLGSKVIADEITQSGMGGIPKEAKLPVTDRLLREAGLIRPLQVASGRRSEASKGSETWHIEPIKDAKYYSVDLENGGGENNAAPDVDKPEKDTSSSGGGGGGGGGMLDSVKSFFGGGSDSSGSSGGYDDMIESWKKGKSYGGGAGGSSGSSGSISGGSSGSGGSSTGPQIQASSLFMNDTGGSTTGGGGGSSTPPPRTSDSKAIEDAAQLGGQLTPAIFKKITSGRMNYETVVPQLVAAGINTPAKQAMFLAQIGHESGFKPIMENMGYSKAQLRKMGLPESIAGNKVEVANRKYGNRKDLGNRGYESGDGYRFLGKGYIQLTGRANTKLFGETVGMTPEQAAEYALTPEGALKSSLWFWTRNNLNSKIDEKNPYASVTTVSRRINGGDNGLDDRKKRFNKYYKLILSGKGPVPQPAPPPKPEETSLSPVETAQASNSAQTTDATTASAIANTTTANNTTAPSTTTAPSAPSSTGGGGSSSNSHVYGAGTFTTDPSGGSTTGGSTDTISNPSGASGDSLQRTNAILADQLVVQREILGSIKELIMASKGAMLTASTPGPKTLPEPAINMQRPAGFGQEFL